MKGKREVREITEEYNVLFYEQGALDDVSDALYIISTGDDYFMMI